MTAADPCPNPNCGTGFLTRLLGTAWLRCGDCRTAYDGHGHAYDEAMYQQLSWRQA